MCWDESVMYVYFYRRYEKGIKACYSYGFPGNNI